MPRSTQWGYQLQQSLISYQNARLGLGHWLLLDNKSLTAPELLLFLYVAPATVITIIATSLSAMATTKE